MNIYYYTNGSPINCHDHTTNYLTEWLCELEHYLDNQENDFQSTSIRNVKVTILTTWFTAAVGSLMYVIKKVDELVFSSDNSDSDDSESNDFDSDSEYNPAPPHPLLPTNYGALPPVIPDYFSGCLAMPLPPSPVTSLPSSSSSAVDTSTQTEEIAMPPRAESTHSQSAQIDNVLTQNQNITLQNGPFTFPPFEVTTQTDLQNLLAGEDNYENGGKTPS